MGKTLAWLFLLLPLSACTPANVSEAEARGDVKWLVANGSPEAVAALGRLADKNPKALEAVDSRTSFDTNAFIAAWTATVRGAAWGPATIKKGLADPTRAEVTASAMGRGDAHLVGFVTDLEGALSRLSASLQNISIATTLASAGPPAHPAIVRRLADVATRGAMCRGIASSDASADAKKTLTQVPLESRDDRWCVDAAIHVAADDDDAATWLAKTAEPGLLIAAGTNDSMPCAKLHVIWTKAIAERPAALYSALIVPLGDAIKRCPQEMDGVLADAITRLPASHPLVVMAIDPFSDYTNSLKATCTALVKVGSSGRDSGRVREHAMDTLARGCKR